MNDRIVENIINLFKNEEWSYSIHIYYCDGGLSYSLDYTKTEIVILENISGISKISICLSNDYDCSTVFEYEEKYDKENFNLLLNAINDYFKRNPDLYKKLEKDKKKKINQIITNKRKIINHLREDIVMLKNLLKAIN